ncbi:flagellar basal body P-ring formation chaperone FlgA [Ferrovibrio sp.]|uniref:flagellar basal body P-ring formation chaperone FlgA n=1 Tax=Ferrovibrio sp. TaxID=1917215 RepID=UPI00311E5E68
MTQLRTALLTGLTAAVLLLGAGVASPAAAQNQVATATTPAAGLRFISEREIARRIADLITQRNGGQPVEVSFHGYGNEIEVPAGMPATLQVAGFSFDARSGRFVADLTAPGRRETMRVSGRATAIESIPVLKNRIAPGDTIARGDIEWVQVPAGRYGGGYIDKASELVGQSPRRPLRTGEPIRSADIGRPEAIAKNTLVTMIAQGPGLTITTTGRALDAGSIGDVIQVMNLQSKKTVQATITGPDQVQVLTAAHVIAAN